MDSSFGLLDAFAFVVFAILIAAAEPAGPALTLGERVRRLFADRGQTEAIFAPDGALLHATAAAGARLGAVTTLSALGVDALAAQAVASGSAEGATRFGPVEIKRLGSGASTALVLTFGPKPSEAPAPENGPEASEAIVYAISKQITSRRFRTCR